MGLCPVGFPVPSPWHNLGRGTEFLCMSVPFLHNKGFQLLLVNFPVPMGSHSVSSSQQGLTRSPYFTSAALLRSSSPEAGPERLILVGVVYWGSRGQREAGWSQEKSSKHAVWAGDQPQPGPTQGSELWTMNSPGSILSSARGVRVCVCVLYLCT